MGVILRIKKRSMRPRGRAPAGDLAGSMPDAGRVAGAMDELVPPTRLISDGSTSQEEFMRVGEGFTRYFLIDHARLQPGERVLDLGCGIGQKARVLAKYLSGEGSYEGLDIIADGIEWCQERYQSLGNFRFQLADIFNTHYNPGGKHEACEYRFPFDAAEFDLVFLSSVFTHMLPRDMTHYLTEIARVLKTGGRCVITYFLLNDESSSRMDAGLSTMKFPHAYESEACRVRDSESPETAVAHDERVVRGLYEQNGLSITEITYGHWCGRRDLVGGLQDVIIAVKE